MIASRVCLLSYLVCVWVEMNRKIRVGFQYSFIQIELAVHHLPTEAHNLAACSSSEMERKSWAGYIDIKFVRDYRA